MAYNVTVIPGDGIGPEVVKATTRVLDATGVPFHWDVQKAGLVTVQEEGIALPKRVVESLRRNRVGLKGPTITRSPSQSTNLELRIGLDLYGCVRPCKLYPGVLSRYPKVDIVIVRENTEDLYSNIEFAKGTSQAQRLIAMAEEVGRKGVRQDSGFTIKAISEMASRRIAKFAFEYARTRGRKKVTVGHRANALRASDGIFLQAAQETSRQYPETQFEEAIVDNLCLQLVRNPENFDILLLPNFYGDLISDLCAGLVGGLGIAPGANIGERGGVFEAVHGSAPRYKGMNKVNPTAIIMSGVLMLRHLGERAAADRIEQAVAAVIAEGRYVTYDFKPTRDDPTAVGTSQMADAIIRKMQEVKAHA